MRIKHNAPAWEQRKFSEIAARRNELSSDPVLPQVEYEDVNSGQGTLNKDLVEKEGGKTGIRFDKGDILYGKLRPYLKNWLLPAFSGVAVGDWWVLKPQEIDSSFLYTLIQGGSYQSSVNISSGSKMPRADWHLVSSTIFKVPRNAGEQRQIGTLFQQLDTLITLHQRKLISHEIALISALRKRLQAQQEKRVSDGF